MGKTNGGGCPRHKRALVRVTPLNCMLSTIPSLHFIHSTVFFALFCRPRTLLTIPPPFSEPLRCSESPFTYTYHCIGKVSPGPSRVGLGASRGAVDFLA